MTADAEVTIGEVPEGTDWKRPHPYTLLIVLVSSVRDLIFPIAFILLQSSNADSGSLLVEVLPVVLIALPVSTAIARYYSTRYAITEDALHHHYGVIRRNKQVLPRRNIQNLSTQAGLIARATGLQELNVSDASQGGDITLRLLSEADADALMALLRRDAKIPSPAAALSDSGMAAPTGMPAAEAEPVYALEIADLIKHRFITGPLPIIAVTAALLLAFGGPLFLSVTEADDFSWTGTLVALAPALTGIAIAFGQVFQLGGFRLWSDPDRLRIKTGLLTEVQMTARRDRIQMVQVDRHVFGRWIGLEAVRFETADVEGGANVSHLAPASAWDTWKFFASDALGEVELGEESLQRVSPLTRRRSLVRFANVGLLVFGLFAVVPAVVDQLPLWLYAPGLLALAVYAAFALWYATRRAARLGWAVGHDQFLFRNGVIGERLYLVRKEKVQTLRIHQSFFQRRLGLATLQLGTAGKGLLGFVSLPDLELEKAEKILNHLARVSAETPLQRTL